MGKTCETMYDACAAELQNCKNGATCMTSPPSRDFNCSCVTGYSGTDCGENIDDCIGNNCTAPQVCFDGLNQFRCACPVGKCMAYCNMPKFWDI